MACSAVVLRCRDVGGQDSGSMQGRHGWSPPSGWMERTIRCLLDRARPWSEVDRRLEPGALVGEPIDAAGDTRGRARSSATASILAIIGNEFQQRAVGVAEINASAGALGAKALDRPGVARDTAALKVDDGVRNWPVPLEAEVAVARLDRKARHLGRMKARSVQIELRGAETVGPP